MKTRTTTVREGEKIGEVDWSYNFRSHFNNYCTTTAGQDAICEKSVQCFREVVEAFNAGKIVKTTTYGGWPRCGYSEVVDSGMYDGWPYWKPTPSVQVLNWDGSTSWDCFSLLTDYTVAAPEGGAA